MPTAWVSPAYYKIFKSTIHDLSNLATFQ